MKANKDQVAACLADILVVRIVQEAAAASDMIQVGEDHMDVVDTAEGSMAADIVMEVDHTVVETVVGEVDCMGGKIAGMVERYSEDGIVLGEANHTPTDYFVGVRSVVVKGEDNRMLMDHLLVGLPYLANFGVHYQVVAHSWVFVNVDLVPEVTTCQSVVQTLLGP